MLAEFRPEGRLSRGAFWLRHFTSIPLAVGLAAAVEQAWGPPFDLAFALLLLLLLISAWGRRLHDRGRSAWWLLVALVPVLGPVCLFVECACRSTSAQAPRFGTMPQERLDHLTVR